MSNAGKKFTTEEEQEKKGALTDFRHVYDQQGLPVVPLLQKKVDVSDAVAEAKNLKQLKTELQNERGWKQCEMVKVSFMRIFFDKADTESSVNELASAIASTWSATKENILIRGNVILIKYAEAQCKTRKAVPVNLFQYWLYNSCVLHFRQNWEKFSSAVKQDILGDCKHFRGGQGKKMGREQKLTL